MFPLFHTIVIALVMFAATNADDLLLLTMLFGARSSRGASIVGGQLVGIGALVAISYTAAMLSLAVPHQWVPWLGIIPFAIGVQWLRRRKGDDPAPVATTWWAVAGITIANGSDNLGVYIPAFTVQTGSQLVVTSVVFTLMTLVWCWIAWSATRHPSWGPTISRICERIGPFVLMAVGLWIIAHHPIFGLNLG